MFYGVIVTEFYTPANGGRSYWSERWVANMLAESEAKAKADELNIKATENQYYSIRKMEY